ncbi:MAG: hypothetical protein RIS43_948 [Actinomycetota bacterium]
MNFIRAAAAHLIRISVCAAVLYSAALLALHFTGFSFVTVVSDSMRPFVERGDLVIVTTKPPQTNDVVLFRQDSTFVLHRLVRQDAEQNWISRGDANSAEDPWKVNPRDIKGVARYVIRGFGIPLLAWQSAVAAFTKTSATSASAKSSYWQQAAMTWKIYANPVYLPTKAPNYVSMIWNGDRKIWSAQSFSSSAHFHMFGRLSNVDSQVGGFHVLLNACVTTADVVNCGLAVTFNNQTKRIQLRSITSGVFSSDWAFTPFGFALNQDHHYSIYRGTNTLQIQVDGEMLLNIKDLNALAQTARSTIPTGTSCGVWLSGSNRMSDARINFW